MAARAGAPVHPSARAAARGGRRPGAGGWHRRPGGGDRRRDPAQRAVAFVQERQAEAAVEALQDDLAPHAQVIRDGRHRLIDAAELVPGDVLLIAGGEHVPADARLLEGSLEVDLAALTGESVTVFRSPDQPAAGTPLLECGDLVFSGTICTGGDAHALVFATGMHTQLGRLAALSERVSTDDSPLQIEVRRVATLIALVAVVAGAAFVPVGAHAPDCRWPRR